MPKAYRVMVSENQDLYPGRTFIDFAPAQVGNDNFSTHEVLLQLRQKIYPELEGLTDGLFLLDYGDGDIRFKTENTDNPSLMEYQKNTLNKFRQQILDSFHQMHSAGKDRTLEVNNYNMAEIIDFYSRAQIETPRSAKETILREKSKYYHDLEQRRKDLLASRHEKYESTPDFDAAKFKKLYKRDDYLS